MRRYFLFIAIALTAACTLPSPKVPPLVIDLPASYKSDAAAYKFIKEQTTAWNAFGKEVDLLYRKGEKWRKRDFASLSEKELYKLVKLDYDYAQLWAVQDASISRMMLEAEVIYKDLSQQGAAKVIESQATIVQYYRQLVDAYGKDLKLDQAPVTLPPHTEEQ